MVTFCVSSFDVNCDGVQEEDYADKLLTEEKSHLLSLKRTLESQLRKVKDKLQELNKVRARLAAAVQERSRVTDLLCQSMSSASNAPMSRMRPSRRSNTTHMPQLVQGKLNSSRSSRSLPSRSKSFSAPVPLSLGNTDRQSPLVSSRESQRSNRQKLGDGTSERAGMFVIIAITNI